ncbi:hypothetical protein [Floridanema evergladense]|uniref:Uncharacterized protein n=1 Tax=Floridaenema evergladense BLCC-F167 TaxID=3153639 RepID=A0ABV4WII3_9CYAN
MTTILANVQQLLDSGNIDGAREEVAKSLNNLKAVDASIRDFAALLALGSENALEIGLGVLGRELLKKDEEVNIEAIWLLLAAVLSRQNITPDSPSRISILGLTSCIENWELPIFALLTPALDSFFQVSLSEGSPLIAEQTLDFIATWGESYAKAPRTKKQLKELKSLTTSLLDKVDDLELKDEWAEGLDTFFQSADDRKYSDERIWSAASDLLKKIYTSKILNNDTESKKYSRTKENISRLIISSLAALGTILGDDGLSVAVRINNPKENNSWSVVASAIDKLERLFQEVADVIPSISKLPKFTPAQAIPGSWTIILHISLNSNQSTELATAIKSISSIEYNGENENNSSLADSWRDCVARLKQDDLRVYMAVSTNDPKLRVVRSISTEDIDKVNFQESVQPNIRVLSRDVPQADNLERVLDFASLLIQYPSSPQIVRQKFSEIEGITDRQLSYYRRAVEILGLADERGRPTTACSILNRLSIEAKMRFLTYQFISSNVGAAWFNWQSANDLSEIQPETAVTFLTEVCPSLSESTARRRAQTLESWLKIFIEYW